MWQTDVSVSKCYNIDDNIGRYLREGDIPFVNVNIGNRCVYSIVEHNDKKRDILDRILRQLILVDMKYTYFINKLGIANNNAEQILLCEMIFFDSIFENNIVEDIIKVQYNYSIDGILNFRMKELRENWDYLIELFNNVRGDEYATITLAEYVHESAADMSKKIYLTERTNKIVMFDVTNGEEVVNINLFNNREANILLMLASTHTNEVYVDKRCKFVIPSGIGSNIMSVKYV